MISRNSKWLGQSNDDDDDDDVIIKLSQHSHCVWYSESTIKITHSSKKTLTCNLQQTKQNKIKLWSPIVFSELKLIPISYKHVGTKLLLQSTSS